MPRWIISCAAALLLAVTAFAGDTSTVTIAADDWENLGTESRWERKFDVNYNGHMMLVEAHDDFDTVRVAKSVTRGASWKLDTLDLWAANVSAVGLYRKYNHFYILAADYGAGEVTLSAYRDSTLIGHDTVLAAGAVNNQGRQALFIPDTSITAVVAVGHDGTPDSTWTMKSDGQFPGTWSNAVDGGDNAMGAGPRVMFDLFTIYYKQAAVGDVWGVFDSSAIDVNIGGGLFEYDGVAGNVAIPIVDSHGVWIEQKDAATGDDSIMIRPFWVSRAGGGSVNFTDTTTIDDGTNLTDGQDASPCITHLRGTDTLFAYWLRNSGTDFAVYKSISADTGHTWSAPALWRQAEAAMYRMWAPSSIGYVNDSLVECVTWFTTSTGAGDAKIFRDITVTGGEEATGAQVIIIN
jgi:hypothetical protein